MEDRINKIISSLKEIEKYKIIEREIWLSNLKRKESDTEHSWHLAMFSILFEKELPDCIDMKRMLKMALIPDLIEIYVRDTFAFDKKNQETKEKENKKLEENYSHNSQRTLAWNLMIYSTSLKIKKQVRLE